MNYRYLISSIFLTVSGVLIGVSFNGNTGVTFSDFSLNLGTEIIGIVVTVLIVELLFERARLEREAKNTAWRALHEIDHAIWAWQGGNRAFSIDELISMLKLDNENDPIIPSVEDLFMRLGSQAEYTLRLDKNQCDVNSQLRASLEVLSPLSRMRDPERVVPPVVDIVLDATLKLSNAVGLEYSNVDIEQYTAFRKPEEKHQERRMHGL